jgi:uncharacterized protein (TIGR02145 family)
MLKVCEVGRAVLVSAMLLTAAVSAFGANPPALAGRWVLEEGGRAPAGFPGNMELLRDGTCIVDGKSRAWKTEGGRFYFMGDKALAYDYKLAGSALTLKNDDGKEVSYLTLAAAKKAEDAKDAAAQAVKTGASTLTDSRNNKTYKTVKIAGKTWMAENLNYQTGNSWCYGGLAANCAKYGRLYDWKTASTACPSGWHLPSNQEWTALMTVMGGHAVAAKKLKAVSGWTGKGSGTDEFGFAATPGGQRRNDGKYYGIGNDGSWWSATEVEGDLAYYRGIFYESEKVYEFNYDWGYGFSVRCIQD